jgi:hypothetical protein
MIQKGAIYVKFEGWEVEMEFIIMLIAACLINIFCWLSGKDVHAGFIEWWDKNM